MEVPTLLTNQDQFLDELDTRFAEIESMLSGPAIIQKILAHLDDNATSVATALLPDSRASPTVSLFV